MRSPTNLAKPQPIDMNALILPLRSLCGLTQEQLVVSSTVGWVEPAKPNTHMGF